MGIPKLIRNKKGLEFQKAFFAVIAFSMMIVAMGVVLSEWSDYYGSGVTYGLDTYDVSDDISGSAGDQQSRLSPDNADPGNDFEATTYTGAFGVVKTFFSSFRVVFGSEGMIHSAASQFGIPNYVIQGIITMMIISVALGIVAIVFRLSRSSA